MSPSILDGLALEIERYQDGYAVSSPALETIAERFREGAVALRKYEEDAVDVDSARDEVDEAKADAKEALEKAKLAADKAESAEAEIKRFRVELAEARDALHEYTRAVRVCQGRGYDPGKDDLSKWLLAHVPVVIREGDFV